MSSECSPSIVSRTSSRPRRRARAMFSCSKKAPRTSVISGGIKHFGFRLTDARDIDRAVKAIERAGGKIKHRGEFCPGEPYVFFTDPDGYEVEVWYEIPTETGR